ncbi:hypothetical protein K435DRAFT_865785 [Dendrothele bispora CBS 962.96]|uniref:Uncharacterized protein n=1 Tax=Dendrothele bispora (strain CBS 962.96) TaxID=1314807 RepID=A0A4V4HDW9_DENBC|nr:hypothetical protein K435DRAFT_865785 [Dendrothele bispora CBS 962.96]
MGTTSETLEGMTPERLKADNQLLIRTKPESQSTPYSTFNAAVFEDGRFFVTTPYRDLKPRLPVMIVSGMRMRHDYRFGTDDYIQWPQPWCRPLCHLACIMKKPPPEDEWSVMWKRPSRDCFVEDRTGYATGLGLLESSFFQEIQNVVSKLVTRTKIFCISHRNESEVSLAKQYSRHLSERITRVESIPCGIRQVCMLVTSIQRCALELHALMAYCTIFKPKMESDPLPGVPPASVVGAFVWKHDDAALLFRAGIPFWFIHPCRDAGGVHVQGISQLANRDNVCLAECDYPVEVIFNGLPNVELQYAAVMGFLDSAFQTFPPFLPTSFNAIDVSAAGSRFIHGSSHAPKVPSHKSNALYSKQKPNVNNQSRHVGSYIGNPLIPQFSTSWSKSYNTLPESRAPSTKPQGFAYPDPMLLVAVQTQAKRNAYCVNWMRFKNLLLFRVTRPGPTMFSNSIWRQLLSGDFVSDHAETGQLPTMASRRKSEVRTLLANCLTERGVDLDLTRLPDSVQWRGSTFDNGYVFSDRLIQSIFAELSILNFRCELTAVDKHLTPRHLRSVQHEDDLAYCCYAADSGDPLVVDLESRKRGFAANNVADRMSSVTALRGLMSDWTGTGDRVYCLQQFNVKELRSDQDRLVYEEKVVNCYVVTAFECLGRYPVTPVCLSSVN